MHLLLLICTLACATARGGAEPPTPRHQLELLLPPADPSGPLQVECALTPRDLDRMRVVFTVTAGETVTLQTWLLLDTQSTTPRYFMGREPAEVARPLRCALAYWPISDESALSPTTMNWRGRQYATSASMVVRGVEAPRDP